MTLMATASFLQKRPTSGNIRRGPFLFSGHFMRCLQSYILAVLLLGSMSFFSIIHGKTLDSFASTTAPVALLVDGESGSILAEKNALKQFNPGDMTKLMTAEVIFDALKRRKLSLDDEFFISERAWQRGRGGSMFARLDSYVRVEDLLRGIAVLSADDGAIALAEGVSGQESDFVQIMNERAQHIGLKNTLFSNSTGSGTVEQVTTARDLAVLARQISRKYPDYYRLYGEKSFSWSKIEQHNRNSLLTLDASADGLKAARQTADGFALVGRAVRDDKILIVVVSGLKTSNDAATEAQKLLQWGFETFNPRFLFNANEPLASVKVYGGTNSTVPAVTHVPVRILWQKDGAERLTMKIEYSAPLEAPVRKGDRIGKLRIMKGSLTALVLPVYADTDIAEGSIFNRAASASGELWGRMFRHIWQRTVALVKK